eukprot:gene37719-45823_t
MQQGSGTTYEYSGNTTEWDDILIKKGIRTKEEVLLEKGLNPADYIKKEEVEEEEEEVDKLAGLNVDQLDELEDDEDFADTNILDHYRKARLAELKQAAVRNRFGEVLPITKDDWVREVTDGSKSCPVVIHLYEDSKVECNLLDEALTVLAERFKYVKFLRIKYNQAIENWPERNLPTLFVYQNGALATQLITLKQVGGTRMNTADIEWFLAKNNVVTDSELESNPREEEGGSPGKTVFRARRPADDDDDEDM